MEQTAEGSELSVSDGSLTPRHTSASGFERRLEFGYKAIEDTQNTVRFLDTKTAFCVTLLSAAMAVVLQSPEGRFAHRHWLLDLFLLAVGATLLFCLRVIFPTIRPPRRHARAETSGPKFYLGPGAGSHRIRHALASPRGNILAESFDQYAASLRTANDEQLLTSLAATIVTLSVIRQVKSDRLHAAMFGLVVSILLFAVLMVTS